MAQPPGRRTVRRSSTCAALDHSAGVKPLRSLLVLTWVAFGLVGRPAAAQKGAEVPLAEELGAEVQISDPAALRAALQAGRRDIVVTEHLVLPADDSVDFWATMGPGPLSIRVRCCGGCAVCLPGCRQAAVQLHKARARRAIARSLCRRPSPAGALHSAARAPR